MAHWPQPPTPPEVSLPDSVKGEDARRRKESVEASRGAAHGRGIASDILHDVIVVITLPLTLIRALFSLPRLLRGRSRKSDES